MKLPSELTWLLLGDPCWYCLKELIPDAVMELKNKEPFLKQNIVVCWHCGWWMLMEHDFSELDEKQRCKTTTYFSKLHSFEAADKSVELNILSSSLARDWENIKKIHPKKFEELTADIIKTIYKCEVKLTGYSKDDGIDFYSVICDQPWAFQVKRRSNNSVEGLEEIKEFIGSMIQNNLPRGIFITSAPRFTKGALKLAKNDNLGLFGLKLDLINGNEIKEYFKLYYSSKDAIWKDLYKGDTEEIIRTVKEYNNIK